MKFDIIIPSWNMAGMAIKCIESIEKYSKDYRIIFVDNGSEKDELDKIIPVLKKTNCLLLCNSSNLGFVKATNIGIKASDAPYIILMNNDTEAVDGWLEKLVEPLEDVNSCGLSAPLTTTPLSWQGKWPKGGVGYVIRNHGMLAFFCTMIKREVIDTVGLLDEDYGVGFGDDDDYCARALDKGYSLALVQDLVIPHHHRTSFKKRYSDSTIRNMQIEALKLFRKKNKK